MILMPKSGVELSLEQVEAKLKSRADYSGAQIGIEDGRFLSVRSSLFGGTKSLTLPPANKLKQWAEERTIEWKEGYEERVIPYFASDERVDSYGDIVLQNWHLEEFAKNSVMPLSHRWSEPPVANSLGEKIVEREDRTYKGRALSLYGLFPDAEVSERSDSTFKLIKAGLMKGGSVGFWSGKAIWVEDPKERIELGLGAWGMLLDDNHLLEFSPTSIPANSGALAVLNSAKNDGLISAKEFNLLREINRRSVARGEGDKKKWLELDDLLVRMGQVVFKGQEFKVHTNLDEPVLEFPKRAEKKEIPDSEKIELVSLRTKVDLLESRLTSLNSLVEDYLLRGTEHKEVVVPTSVEEALAEKVLSRLENFKLEAF